MVRDREHTVAHGCMYVCVPAASLREKASHQSPARGCGTGGGCAGKARSGLRFLRFAPLSGSMTSATPEGSTEEAGSH